MIKRDFYGYEIGHDPVSDMVHIANDGDEASFCIARIQIPLFIEDLQKVYQSPPK